MPDLGKLREQIASGEYRFDPKSIASAMLDYADAAEPAPAFGAHAGLVHRPAPRGTRDTRRQSG